MSRWPPDTARRLKASALTLFAERGFANVTAAEVAAGAGMTERTFFRHFRAKEDVLFEDYSGVKDDLVAAVAAAPASASARELMQAAANFLSGRFESEREMLRVFATVVDEEPTLRARAALRDREWGEAIATVFAGRGFPQARAAMLAATMAATFRLAFDAWVGDDDARKPAERFAWALEALGEALR